MTRPSTGARQFETCIKTLTAIQRRTYAEQQGHIAQNLWKCGFLVIWNYYLSGINYSTVSGAIQFPPCQSMEYHNIYLVVVHDLYCAQTGVSINVTLCHFVDVWMYEAECNGFNLLIGTLLSVKSFFLLKLVIVCSNILPAQQLSSLASSFFSRARSIISNGLVVHLVWWQNIVQVWKAVFLFLSLL